MEAATGQDGFPEDILFVSFRPPEGRDLPKAEDRFQKATARADKGEVKEAQRDFKKLVADFPEIAKYHRALGQASLVLQDYDRAEDELLRSLALDPRDPGALTLLGNLYARRGTPAKAIPLYRRSLALEPNVYAFTNLGAALVETGQVDAGVEVLRQAITQDPSYPNAWYGLGLALSRKQGLGFIPEAIECLDGALEQMGGRRASPDLWDTTQELLGTLSQIEARESTPRARAAIEAAIARYSVEGDLPVRLEEGAIKGGQLAKIEFGWVHSRPYHRLLVGLGAGVLREHYVLHELEHLELTCLARRAGTNRWFASNPSTRERAIRSFSSLGRQVL